MLVGFALLTRGRLFLTGFVNQKQISPTAKRKLTGKYPDINVEWDKVYSLLWNRKLGSFNTKS